MNIDLKRINGSPFSSYVGENFPTYSETSYGQLTIIDNTGEQSIKGLIPNTYNLFIDHIHIASGYGFSSYNDFYNEIERISYAYEGVIKIFDAQDDGENISLFDLKLNTTDYANHFATYNTYGFETGFNKFSITNIPGNSKYSYQLNISRYELSYILPIEVQFHNNIWQVEKNEDFKLDIRVSIYGGDNVDQIVSRENIKINGEYINNIYHENNIQNGFDTYTFSFDNINKIYKKDLKIEYTFDDKTVGTYIIPNVLQWGEQIAYYPTSEFINSGNETMIITNGITSDVSSINTNIGVVIDDNMDNKKYIIPEELFEVTFSSGEISLYDQIIITNSNNIEFYYNGIKSNNWNKYTTNLNGNNYTIWTSPQKYRGTRKWQIKLKNGE